MKSPEIERKWWLALSGWLAKHRGRADFLFVYDKKQGRLDRCFDRNVELNTVNAETVGKLYQAAAEGRLGLLRPDDLKPHRLTTDPENIIAPEKETVTAEKEPDKAEQAPMKEEEVPGKEEQPVVKEEQPAAKAEQPAVKAEQAPTAEKKESVPAEQERVAPNRQESVNTGPVSEAESGLNGRKLERAAAEPILAERMRKAEVHYRQVLYVPKKVEPPAPAERSADETVGARRKIKQATALEQAEEMLRNAMPSQPEEDLSSEQSQLAAVLAEMILGLGEPVDQDEDELERKRLAREELIAAQNLFIWAAASYKRDQEESEARMEYLEWMDDWMSWEMEWWERLEDMAQELNDMDLAGASEEECKEKIRDYLDGKQPAKHEHRAEEEHPFTKEMWGNTLRHFCRFAASEVPLSVRHVQVAEKCQKILRGVREHGLSMDDLGLDAQDQMAVHGSIEMGKLVARGLTAQAMLTSGQRFPRNQNRKYLQDYLAMKGIEETLIPHVENYQKEISTGDGPVSAVQVLMGNHGFRADDLRAKVGRTSAVARLERMDHLRVGRMILRGDEEIANLGRQVMIASYQMGVPEPVREPQAPQKGGPAR